jgi:hypothetical protein
VVGFTTGSRGEAPGKRKPVTREHNNNDDDDDDDDDDVPTTSYAEDPSHGQIREFSKSKEPMTGTHK